MGHFDIIQLKIVTYLLHWYFKSFCGVRILISLQVQCRKFLVSKFLLLVSSMTTFTTKGSVRYL